MNHLPYPIDASDSLVFTCTFKYGLIIIHIKNFSSFRDCSTQKVSVSRTLSDVDLCETPWMFSMSGYSARYRTEQSFSGVWSQQDEYRPASPPPPYSEVTALSTITDPDSSRTRQSESHRVLEITSIHVTVSFRPLRIRIDVASPAHVAV